MKKFLIIQTAFIGDVVLATPLASALKEQYPESTVHFLVRKGNESLLENNPNVDRVLIWYKKKSKIINLFRLVRRIRKQKYDAVYNLHRYMSTGILTWLSGANRKLGFDKNPLSRYYTNKIKHKIPHEYQYGFVHEVQRNLQLLGKGVPAIIRPQLYPSPADYDKAASLKSSRPYFIIAPGSVWFTKQWAIEKWQELLSWLPLEADVFLMGGPDDKDLCEQLSAFHPSSRNIAGELSFLESTALMKDAERVFVNDSAPLHFASAINAKTTAIFCSTHPKFGFGPLADERKIVRMQDGVCCSSGLHGHRKCPSGHFDCALKIRVKDVYTPLEKGKHWKKYLSEEDRKNLMVSALNAGKLVICETDTVPGFSGDATNADLVKKLYAIKNRDRSKPFIALVSDIEMLEKYAGQLSVKVRELLALPDKNITVIYPRVSEELQEVAAGNGSLAIRVPKHKWLQEVIRVFGKPIISTSANGAGQPTPVNADEISRYAMEHADHVFLWDEPASGEESVLILETDSGIEVLRGSL